MAVLGNSPTALAAGEPSPARRFSPAIVRFVIRNEVAFTGPPLNTHLPGGVGELGVPPTAPAICNATYAAIAKRIRALPVDPQLLKA